MYEGLVTVPSDVKLIYAHIDIKIFDDKNC